MRWLAIAVMLLLGAALPASAQRAHREAAPAANAYTFFPDGDRAPVAYQSVKGRLVFRARIGEREVWALLDNGADRTLIDMETARDAGFKLGGGNTPVFAAGGGSLASQWVSDVPVSIAGQFEARMPMLALDMRAASKILGYHIELVLGADALAHMALKIDPFARTFHLTQTGRMEGVTTADAIPMRGKRALFEVRIGGKPATVAIDLGSNGALSLSQGAWTRMGATGKHLGTGTATGATGKTYDVEVMQVPAVMFGRHTLRQVDVAIEEPRPGVGDGIVGMEILGRFIIVMDLGAGKLWLIPPLTTE